MRILVSGASGFVGRHLVPDLEARGHEVGLLLRDPRRAGGQRSVWRWSAEERVPPEAVEWADAVVHLAGAPVAVRWTAANRRRIRDSRVHGTRNLVQSIAEAENPPRQLISTSAIGYYGDRGDELLDEGSTPGTDFLATVCREWEEEARRAEPLGLTVLCLRLGLVLGVGGGMLGPQLPLFRMGLGGTLGSGRQQQSWIHMTDVLGLIAFALEGGHGGTWNATAPGPVPQRDFARTLGRVLGRPALVPVPALALRATLGGFSVEVLGGKRVIPRAAQAAGYTFRFAELEAALRDLLDSR